MSKLFFINLYLLFQEIERKTTQTNMFKKNMDLYHVWPKNPELSDDVQHSEGHGEGAQEEV